MNKNFCLPDATAKKSVFTIACMVLLSASCSKEKSGEAPPPKISYNIFTMQTPSGPTQNDNTGGIELGVKFRSSVAAYVEGVRFYKTAGNTGTHTGQLYSAQGTLLATKVFSNETDSGWQSVIFDASVPILANTTYIAAYHSSLGNYTSTDFGLKTAVVNGPLTALADSTEGPNGIYKYTNIPALPDTGYLADNYWIDVIVKEK